MCQVESFRGFNPPKEEESEMNRTANPGGRVHCVDLAKNKFQTHLYSAAAERLQQRTLSRARFDQSMSDPRPGDLVVMEACGSSHYWGRRLERRGFRVKLVPAQFVAKQRLGNKTDGNDADGIFAVHRDPRVRPVPVKTVHQQDLCALHRLRELLVQQRTQYINQARGLLAERGCVAARGERGFAALLSQVATHPSEDVSPALLGVIGVIREQIAQVEQQLAGVEQRLGAALRQSALAQRIDTVFGVGTVTATAFDAEYGQGVGRFADARQFAAGIGIAPSEHSSGETRRLGRITRRGNPYLRRLLVQGAQSVLTASTRRDDPLCRLARRLLAQGKSRNTVVIAVANRMARIIFAVIRDGTEYHGAARLKKAA
jgi:transposase